MRIPLLMAVVCLLCGAQPTLTIAPFTIKDQYGIEKTIGGPSTEWTYLVYGDRTGGDYNQNWGTGLRARANARPPGRVLFAANLRSVPFFMRGMVTKKFVGDPVAGKKKGSILLDWQGQIETVFGHTPSVSNVYAFDPAGKMRTKDAGKGSEAELDRFVAAVRRAAEN